MSHLRLLDSGKSLSLVVTHMGNIAQIILSKSDKLRIKCSQLFIVKSVRFLDYDKTDEGSVNSLST